MTGKRRLGLTAMAALLAAALLSTPARAERAVGLEARGVSPWAAVHNDQRLDVRDALGRPVSAQVIARQLEAAAAPKTAQAAAVSRLPKARVIFRLLELIPSLTGFWSRLCNGFPPRAALGLVPRARTSPRTAGLPVLLAAAGLILAACCRASRTISSRSLQKTVVLRC